VRGLAVEDGGRSLGVWTNHERLRMQGRKGKNGEPGDKHHNKSLANLGEGGKKPCPPHLENVGGQGRGNYSGLGSMGQIRKRGAED